uniref:Bulb-type lectin domain-containing protein n=1 Tax=Vitis vinifera TaxID=29760 RepID=A5C9C7_VITVI|nr:hypothetical protein VITISV_026971 [Vitis vinifera]
MEGKMIRRKFVVHVSATLHGSLTNNNRGQNDKKKIHDTITPEDWLRNDGGTLVSVGKTFELGFFNSDGRFNNGKYIGIWYYLLKPQKVVWVANRDSPLPLSDPPSGVFAIKDDGKLKLLDENGKVHWSSNTETSLSTGMVMKLMDSGNLVLSDNRSRGDSLGELP